MAVASFNSNIAASGVLRRLDTISRDVSASFSRLSTGLRINKASDDAAGLAIADKLRVDARLSNAALRNVNDGISLINIADGTLEDQSNILTRLMELANQASNGTISSAQRSALNKEYQSLVDEFGRLGVATRFNNLSPLNGNSTGLSQVLLQAGITGSSTSSLGISTGNTGTLSGTISLSSLVQGVVGDLSSQTFNQVAAAYNNMVMRIEVTDNTGVVRETLIALSFLPDGGTGAYLQIDILNRESDLYGIPGETWGTNQNIVVSLGENIPYTFQTPTASVDIGFVGGQTATVTLDLRSLYLASNVWTDATPSAIDFTGVENTSRAQSALTTTRQRLTEIGQLRGTFGALASRLGSSAALLASSRSNLLAAESQIRDVDVAGEAAHLAAAQIRQQGAIATHKLAINQPELLLSLITSSGS